MDRKEAIKVLKEMIAENNVEIMNFVNIASPSEGNNTLSSGYQIEAKGVIIHNIKEFQALVVKHGLVAREEIDRIIIYEPIVEPSIVKLLL